MKIYIWNVDFMENQTPGLAVVIANNESEAKKILLKKMSENGMDYDRYVKQALSGPDEEHELKPSAFYIGGGS